MSKVLMLRDFVSQRLTAAAAEIFELFERTVAEYEEELYHAKENQRKILETVYNPEVRLHRADKQLLVGKRTSSPKKQQWSSSLEYNDPPEPPLIKEELEETWTTKEGEQCQGLEEAEILKFTFTPGLGAEEKPQTSQLHQSDTKVNGDTDYVKTEADVNDGGGSEPVRSFHPDTHSQPTSSNESSHSESETNDFIFDLGGSRQPMSALNALQNNEKPVSDSEIHTSFGQQEEIQKLSVVQNEMESFSCSVCGKQFPRRVSLTHHMKRHSERTCFKCSVCKKSFPWRGEFVRHMRIHTGEKPFSCSVCGMGFSQSAHLTTHLRVHTGEKPFTCSVCKTAFTVRNSLIMHMRIHTGEKPFSCSICGQKFTQYRTQKNHMTVHTGEKPFSCNVCDKKFSRPEYLRKHKCVGKSSDDQE